MQSWELTSAAYIQSPSIELLPATYNSLGTRFISTAYTKPVIFNTSMGYGKKLSNLAKIYIYDT